VTLQTLHPENFDHGTALAQTPPPGLLIPKDGQCTYQELLNFIAPAAAEILVQGIRDRVFDPSSPKGCQVAAQATARATPSQQLRPAPKINSNDRFLNWSLMAAPEIAMRDRVLGRLWFYIATAGDGLRRKKKRAIVHSVEEVHMPLKDLYERNVFFPAALDEGPLQEVAFWRSKAEPGAVVAHGDGGGMVLIREITVDGEKRMPAWQVLDPENGNGFGAVWNDYSNAAMRGR
jgi:methionyl-tRNA formyltransferase